MYHVQTYKAWVLVLAAAATLPCSLKATPPAEGAAPNIVLVVLDDVGTDRLAFYGEGPTPAPTPQLSALAAGGVVFTNAWGSATCTPARAMINTGQYGIHSGIGSNPDQGGGDGLPLNAQILPECLSGKYTSVAVGKWHLGDDGQGPYHPNDSGYALYSGSLKNLNSNPTAEDYFNWQHTINGTTSWKSVYAPTVNINDSIRSAVCRRFLSGYKGFALPRETPAKQLVAFLCVVHRVAYHPRSLCGLTCNLMLQISRCLMMTSCITKFLNQ